MLSSWLWRLAASATLIFCFFTLPSPSSADLIKCFNCSSWENAECLYVKANDTNSPFVHACDDEEIPAGAEPFCRTIVQTIRDGNGTKRLRRKCGWIKHIKEKTGETPPCYKLSYTNQEEIVCQCFTDLCNSSPSHLSSVLPVTLLLPVALYTYFAR